MAKGFRIIDVFEELGVAQTKNATWSAGSRMANLYARETGEQPPKDNRPKTGGVGGTHCFAIYPEEWRARAIEIVRTVATEPDPQPDMFR